MPHGSPLRYSVWLTSGFLFSPSTLGMFSQSFLCTPEHGHSKTSLNYYFFVPVKGKCNAMATRLCASNFVRKVEERLKIHFIYRRRIKKKASFWLLKLRSGLTLDPHCLIISGQVLYKNSRTTVCVCVCACRVRLPT